MTVHVIGTGIAGMAAAMALRGKGVPVIVWEAAGHAGGRARSFHDSRLNAEIDNGTHLMLAVNAAVLRLADRLGSRRALAVAEAARFPLFDAATGERLLFVAPPRGLPRLEFLNGAGGTGSPLQRPGLRELVRLAALPFRAAAGRTVAEALSDSPFWRPFWQPLALGVLNTDPEEGALSPLLRVLMETLPRGGQAMRPVLAAEGLSAVFARPFLDRAASDSGLTVHLNSPVQALRLNGPRIAALMVGHRGRTAAVTLEAGDAVILAVPPWTARRLLPALMAPDDFRPIVNVHFRLKTPPQPPFPAVAPGLFLTGVLDGTAQWIFGRGDVVSVTVSDARHLDDLSGEEIARACWADVRRALALPSAAGNGDSPAGDVDPGALPPWRVIRERRATFACTAVQLARRPPARTGLANLFLAGDWTATGLPATLEGAARSGEKAAALALVLTASP